MRKLLALLLFLAAPFTMYAGQSSNQMVLSSPATTTCTTAGQQLVAKNSRRAYLLCVNNGTATVYIAQNAAPTSTTGIPVAVGQSIVWEQSAPINSMYCLASSGSQAVVCQEGN